MQSRNVCPVFDTGTDVITGRKQKFRRCVQKGTSPLDCLPAPIALRGSATSAPRLRIDLPFGLGGFSMADSPMNGMALQFSRVVFAVEDMEIWNASSNGFSFVISYESSAGPGFHGRSISRPRTYGFVASWRPIHQNRCAVRIIGSPFKMLAEAEEACKVMLGHLTSCSG